MGCVILCQGRAFMVVALIQIIARGESEDLVRSSAFASPAFLRGPPVPALSNVICPVPVDSSMGYFELETAPGKGMMSSPDVRGNLEIGGHGEDGVIGYCDGAEVACSNRRDGAEIFSMGGQPYLSSTTAEGASRARCCLWVQMI